MLMQCCISSSLIQPTDKPWVEVSSHTITITEGDPLHLNCSAVGNPTPTYTWTFPSNNLPQMHNNSVFNINSAAFKHEGTYTCSATNRVGSVKVSFTVEVQGEFYVLTCPFFIFMIVSGKSVSTNAELFFCKVFSQQLQSLTLRSISTGI